MSKLKIHWLKKKKIAYFALGFALCLLVLGGAQKSIASAQVGNSLESVEDSILRAVAGYVVDHGDGLLAGKLLDILIERKQERLGIISDINQRSPISNVCFRDSDGLRCVVQGWEEMTLSAASTTTAEPNMLSVPYFIDYAEIEVNGVVSSSFALSMGTTTAGFVNNPATTTQASPGNGTPNSGVPDGLIQSTYFVTSSNAGDVGRPTFLAQASSTQRVEMQPNYRYLISASSSARVSPSNVLGYGFQSVPVATSTRVTVFARNIISITSSTIYLPFCDRAAVECEPVTSTNRGWTAQARWRYHYAINL